MNIPRCIDSETETKQTKISKEILLNDFFFCCVFLSISFNSYIGSVLSFYWCLYIEIKHQMKISKKGSFVFARISSFSKSSIQFSV